MDEIVFQIENPQQFWSELEETTKVSPTSNLTVIDYSLRKFVLICAGYHEQFLQAPLQFDHACNLLLDSELFEFHSGRMTNLLTQDATTNTDPHGQLVIHELLIHYGYRNPAFLRSHKKWKPLLPILMDHLQVDFEAENEDLGKGSRNSTQRANMYLPIEGALRILAVDILYQICRVQKMELDDLRVFDDQFISSLFDLVEQTRDMSDDTLNYSLIKLIIALNEQFMLASLPTHKHHPSTSQDANQKAQNRVFVVLLRRLHFSKTFGQNIIFMLNRADCSNSEDHCLQLLILKVLYLLFTTPGTQEYFYTNDLKVLVDVFIRNLSDLGDENDSLRHTFLRVLHPLLTNTQLRNAPYKGVQILRTLEHLVDKADIREISSTTKRLVDRCLGGEWCINLRRQGGLSSPTSSITTADSISDHATHSSLNSAFITTQGGTTHFIVTASSASVATPSPTSPSKLTSSGTGGRSLKSARSFGDLKRRVANKSSQAPPIPARKGAYLMTPSESTGSAASLHSVSAAESPIKGGNGSGKHSGHPHRASTDPDSGLSASSTPGTSISHSRKGSSSLGTDVHGSTGVSHSSKHRDLLGGHQSALNSSTPSLMLTASHSHGSISNGDSDPPKRRKPPPIPARRIGVNGPSNKGIRSISAATGVQ